MTDRLRLITLGMLVAPLAFFYFYYLAWTIKIGAVPPTNLIESVVLATMLVRLAVVISFERLRRAKTSIIIDIFSVEILVTAFLLVLYIGLRTPELLSLMTSLALAWLPALLLVLPPYAIYRFSARVLEDSKLTSVIPTAVGLFALLVLSAEVATRSPGVPGLSGISQLLLAVFLGQTGPASLVPEIRIAGVLLFLSLTLYAVTRGEPGQDRFAPLLVAVAGGVIALGWSAVGSTLTDYSFLLFGLPGLAILGVIWWTTRGS